MTAQPQPRPSDPTHAGGVVYRERAGHVEYLLVQANSAQREWVLPKGHIERGESAREAAVREVLEEAGVRAEIVAELDAVAYTLREKLIRVQFYLMKAMRADTARDDRGKHGHEDREHLWLPLEEARQRLAYDAYRELLALGEMKRLGS